MLILVKKIIIVLLIFSIVFLESGCSMFLPHRQSLKIIPSESDAKIYVNAEYVGTGTVTVLVPRNKTNSIMAKKEGFRTATRDIGTIVSTAGVLDMIGGYIFLLPLIGMAFPGFKSLEHRSVMINLEKET